MPRKKGSGIIPLMSYPRKKILQVAAVVIGVMVVAVCLLCTWPRGASYPKATQAAGGGHSSKPRHSSIGPAAAAKEIAPQKARGAADVDVKRNPHREAYRAAVEAARREHEAFKRMSPEEQQRFRAKKREELLARRRAEHEKGMRENGWRGKRMRGHRRYGPRDGAMAGTVGDAGRRDVAADETSRAERAEIQELRSAALKARAEYEESIGEAADSDHHRRSIGYWMSRVRRERERSAERGRQPASNGKGGDAGAETSDNKPKTETRKE